MRWFDFFKKITKKKKRNEQLLAELKHKIRKMEQIIQNINSKSPEYHINIEKIMIENPQLDNLTFRLDKLDIKELGGALNMGNNFGIIIPRSTISSSLIKTVITSLLFRRLSREVGSNVILIADFYYW